MSEILPLWTHVNSKNARKTDVIINNYSKTAVYSKALSAIKEIDNKLSLPIKKAKFTLPED